MIPIIALSKVAFKIFTLVWIKELEILESVTKLSSPIETYGPIVEFFRTTFSQIKQGCII